MRLRWVLSLCLMLFLATGAGAQEAPATTAAAGKPLAVGVFVEPPFVQATPKGFSGMAIELWQRVADAQGLTYSYTSFSSIKELLAATTSGQVDIAVAGLTITEGRLRRMDFTQPWYNAGQRIMIEASRGYGFSDMWNGLAESGHLTVYAWIIAIVIGATLLLTLVDRAFDEEFPRKWHEGLAESFYHVMSVATSGKANHRHMFGVFGRVLAALWMVCGVTLVAYVTSSITSVMTTNALTNQISGFADLGGKTVGVLKGSVSEDYCREHGIEAVAYDNLQEAVDGLLGREVSALVGDAAVLEYYDRTHPQAPITEVGAAVHRQLMGFALPPGSALTRPVSLGIIAAIEGGAIEELRAKYLVAE